MAAPHLPGGLQLVLPERTHLVALSRRARHPSGEHRIRADDPLARRPTEQRRERGTVAADGRVGQPASQQRLKRSGDLAFPDHADVHGK